MLRISHAIAKGKSHRPYEFGNKVGICGVKIETPGNPKSIGSPESFFTVPETS